MNKPLTTRERANARSYAKVYLQRGHLVAEPCEKCGAADVEMHHDDYRKPLAVRWLCRACHRQHHRENGAAQPEIAKKQKKIPAARKVKNTIIRCLECEARGMVIETRSRIGRLTRRRQCKNGHRWTTVEVRPAVVTSKIGTARIKRATAP